MADDWRLAKSIAKLEDEIETSFPGTTVWDIGDEAHQSTWSDHNPNECCDVVCGADVKGDGGITLPRFVRHLIADPHPNLRYVIFNHKIYERDNDFEAEDYNGSSGHEEHAHVSVGNGPDGRSTTGYDSTASWNIKGLKDGTSSTPSSPSTGTSNLGDRMKEIQQGASGRIVRILQGLLCAWGYTVSIDGQFGPKTTAAVEKFQAKYAKPVDGIVGKITWNALLGIDD